MKCYYREISSGFSEQKDSEPIIFLHGMFQSGECFGNAAPTISSNTKRKVYLLDARNHGESPWTNEMDYDILVEDLLEFMEQNNIEKSVLVGSSMGGRTALYFALKYPHRVEALVVEDMTPQNLETRGPNTVKMLLNFFSRLMKTLPPHLDIETVRMIVFDRLISALGSQYVNEKSREKLDSFDLFPVIKDGNAYRMKCNMTALDTMLEKNALMQNLPEQKPIYDGDALFLYGSKPFFNLGKDPSIKKLFPKVFVKQVKDSSHFIFVDSLDEYVQIISDFILHRRLKE